jgi:hypothetical protein
LEKEVIQFSKKEAGKKTKYAIKIPKSDSTFHTLIKTLGGHGIGFQLMYTDSSIIYFSNDWAIATPNYNNYQKIDLNTIGSRLIDLDTVMFGIQSNGLNWKEIISDNSFIGYLNVSNKNKELYDQSISSIHKR